MTGDEEVVVLEPGDERAQKIGKAIAHPTANGILHILATGPKTASDLTEALNIPMGTLKYHIENLLGAGLIEIAETRYSVKGREVKVYALRDQLLIVAPKVASIRSILLKYTSLFGIVLLATVAVFALVPVFQGTPPGGGPVAFQADNGGGGTAVPVSEKAALPAPGPALISATSVALGFFLGGALVVLFMLLYEVWQWRRETGFQIPE